jgi:hypothetical protein
MWGVAEEDESDVTDVVLRVIALTLQWGERNASTAA